MELKSGYKRTEVGIIPEEWAAKTVGGEIDLLTGYPFPSSGYKESGVRLLRGSNVKRGETDWADDITQYWQSVSPDVARYELRLGDLVIAMDGSLVGRSYAQLKSEDLPALLLQRVARIRSTKLDVTYLTAFVGSERFIKYADSVKTVTAIPHISPDDIRKFTIPVPPSVGEQHAIASALSDVDALLYGLCRLIAKKRNLKQAAMQQLLTGRTRLPGFHGEWNVKRLGDCLLSRPDYGINAAAVPFSDKLPSYIRITDISEQGRFCPDPRVSVHAASADQYYLHRGDVVFARTGASVGKSYLYRPDDGQLVFAGFLIRVRPNPEILVSPFLSAYATTKPYWNWVRLMSMRSGQPGINGNEYAQLPLSLPALLEQTAIAAVLTDMDAELETLEQRLDKTRALKQGMMQELLTGTTRLK
jgi:type I restriction enzyme S subunit